MIKNIPDRLAQVGKIKIGVKGEERQGAKGAYRLPSKVDHFIITTMEKVDGNFRPDENLMKKLDPKNGKPRQLKIALPYDDIDLNFFNEYAMYYGKKRLCFGNGETATRIFLDKETKKEIRRDSTSCPCEYYENGQCKIHGILSVILRENFQLGGVYQFRTTSVNSVINIISGLRQIQKLTQGILAMLPLVMSIQPQSVTDKEGRAQTIFAVNITADVQEWTQLLSAARDIARIRSESAISIRQLEADTRVAIKKQRSREAEEIPDAEEEPEVTDAAYTPITDEAKPNEQEDVNEEFSPTTLQADPPPEFVVCGQLSEEKKPETKEPSRTFGIPFEKPEQTASETTARMDIMSPTNDRFERPEQPINKITLAPIADKPVKQPQQEFPKSLF